MCGGGGRGLERQNKLFAYKQKQYLESIAEIQAHNKFHCTVVLMNNMQPLQESGFADSSNCIQCIIFFSFFFFYKLWQHCHFHNIRTKRNQESFFSPFIFPTSINIITIGECENIVICDLKLPLYCMFWHLNGLTPDLKCEYNVESTSTGAQSLVVS